MNIRDTLACVDIAARNPADRGDFRIFNQFTEQFSVSQLADMVVAAGQRAGLSVAVENLRNPRVEQEEHYYNAKNTALADLGLRPNLLTDEVVDAMLATVRGQTGQVDPRIIAPQIRWAGGEVTEGDS